MALADPQSVTISGTATSVARTGLTLDEGTFGDSTGQVSLTVRHSRTRRVRHTVKLGKTAIVSDPLVPSQNTPVSYSAHIVIDTPSQGVTAAEALAIGKALVTWATDANLTKVIGGES